MRCHVLAVLLLLGFAARPAAAEEDSREHLENKTLANVVYVTAGDNAGTAFLLEYADAKYLVTARHVVAAHLDDPSVPVVFRVGGRRGRVIRSVARARDSLRADVAVFTFEEDPELPYFPDDAGLVPCGDIHLASQVFLVGYPASLRQTYGSSQLRVVGGWVAGVKKYVPGSTVEYVDIDMPGVEHGHSGGPILRLQRDVVAVAVQRRTGSVSGSIAATYAVPIKYVAALIDDEPVAEDVSALNETLRDTAFVCGLALQGKTDYDLWAQRVHRDTGEPVWGEMGIWAASSPSPESEFLVVPADGDGSYVVHTMELEAGGETDIMVQKVSRYGELLFEGGMRSLPVASTKYPERAPTAVSDGRGGLLVAYEIQLLDGDIDVMAQRVDAEGRRSWAVEGVAVASAASKERSPRMVTDGSGGAIVVLERLLPDDDVDIVAQRVLPDGRLAWHEGTKSAEVASAAVPERNARVVSDGAGGAVVVFEVTAKDGYRYLAAQKVSLHGERTWNDGASILLSPLPYAGGPHGVAVIPDGLGGAFIAFEVLPDPSGPQDVDLAVQHVAHDGRLLWGTDREDGQRVPVFAASSRYAERKPTLIGDGRGGVVIGFESGSENGDLDVLAQRLDGDGHLLWFEGQRSADVSLTFLSEHSPRIVERHRDRVLLVFEVERENGRHVVASQALSLDTGKAIFGGGKTPLFVLDPGDAELTFFLNTPEPRK